MQMHMCLLSQRGDGACFRTRNGHGVFVRFRGVSGTAVREPSGRGTELVETGGGEEEHAVLLVVGNAAVKSCRANVCYWPGTLFYE